VERGETAPADLLDMINEPQVCYNPLALVLKAREDDISARENRRLPPL